MRWAEAGYRVIKAFIDRGGPVYGLAALALILGAVCAVAWSLGTSGTAVGGSAAAAYAYVRHIGSRGAPKP
jgi:hypothetical protein